MAEEITRIPALKTVMTPFPYAVSVGDNLERARKMMAEHGIRHLPVMNGGDIVGIISDRDVQRASDPKTGLAPPDGVRVGEACVLNACTMETTVPLDRALEKMASDQIGSVVVVKEGRLAGIFTVTDACRVFADHLKTLFPESDGEEVA